ncbi:hypothetical protein [Candidatus Nanosynbacter sp. TM7-057]|uniref:hypothetical protein n=1 Tax=Candidatus Nanosynbacter sp. TM7-057 TaxID=2902630 RepID=UPI001FB5C922|nr:hypothetical protein [Candidatus Nanosynbacter sp. TM7-057]
MYEKSDKTFDDVVEAAKSVAELVRETLYFRSTGNFSSPLEAVNIAKDEAANCYGHTIVASECLEKLGIEHFISYANQHTFITLFDRSSNRSFIIDVLTEELRCEMTDAIGFDGIDPIEQLYCGELRANSTLYTDLLLQKLPSSVNRSNFVARREWLMFSDGMKYRDGYGRNARLQMLTLPSIPGRLLLLDEYNARIDQLNGRYKEAADKIVDLSGIYLDVDSRNNLKEADKLCRELIKQGSGDLAIQVASVVNDSLLSGDSSKNRLFLPDVIRKVAKHDRDINLLNEAIRLYKEIINSKPKYDILAVGKLRVAEKLLRSMKAAGAIVCDAACDKISE